MKRDVGTAAGRAFRRLALPLGSYYAVTLALPLANGAARSGVHFFHHALVVLAVPPALIVLACLVRMVTRVSFMRRAQGRQRRLVALAPRQVRAAGTRSKTVTIS